MFGASEIKRSNHERKLWEGEDWRRIEETFISILTLSLPKSQSTRFQVVSKCRQMALKDRESKNGSQRRKKQALRNGRPWSRNAFTAQLEQEKKAKRTRIIFLSFFSSLTPNWKSAAGAFSFCSLLLGWEEPDTQHAPKRGETCHAILVD